MLIGTSSHCEAISGNVVAGYLPANPEEIYKHLGHLLEDGETVLPIPCTDHAVLWRESLMDPKRGISAGDGREGRITTLDLAPSLMGLATAFLPDKSFYKKYSRHFAHDGEVAGPTSMGELRARRLKLEASKAQLAEGEEILVKCNALCDRNGPVLRELYDASGTPAQCTIDCAAAYGEFFSGIGKAEALTEPAREASRFVQTANHSTDTSRVLLKCYAECGARRDDASSCTMDCALRHLHVARGGEAGPKHAAASHHLAVDLRASWSSNIPKMTSDPKLRVGAVSRRKAVASSTAARAGTSAKMAALLAV